MSTPHLQQQQEHQRHLHQSPVTLAPTPPAPRINNDIEQNVERPTTTPLTKILTGEIAVMDAQSRLPLRVVRPAPPPLPHHHQRQQHTTTINININNDINTPVMRTRTRTNTSNDGRSHRRKCCHGYPVSPLPWCSAPDHRTKSRGLAPLR